MWPLDIIFFERTNIMKIFKILKSLFQEYVRVKPAVITIASLSILSLTANAAVVEVWQLDNFFTNVENGVPLDP